MPMLIPVAMTLLPEIIGGIGELGGALATALGPAGLLGGIGEIGTDIGGIGTALMGGDIGGALGGLVGLPGVVGQALAPTIGSGLFAAGLPEGVAESAAGFLSPELLGAGLGGAFGGGKGAEMGALAGFGLGGGASNLGQLIGLSGPAQSAFATLAPQAAQAGAAYANRPSIPTIAPQNTVSPMQATTASAVTPGGGTSGLTLAGTTAPQVGPWLQSFWSGQGQGGSQTPAFQPGAMNQPQFTGSAGAVGNTPVIPSP